MTSRRALDALLTVALLLGATSAAWAQVDPGLPPMAQRGPGGRLDAADAVRRAQAESGGRVLGAERVQFDGRDIMRVKVMDQDGRVRYMDSDAMSRRDARRGGEAGPGRDDFPPMRPRRANPPRP